MQIVAGHQVQMDVTAAAAAAGGAGEAETAAQGLNEVLGGQQACKIQVQACVQGTARCDHTNC
jgi:hypothetical protein